MKRYTLSPAGASAPLNLASPSLAWREAEMASSRYPCAARHLRRCANAPAGPATGSGLRVIDFSAHLFCGGVRAGSGRASLAGYLALSGLAHLLGLWLLAATVDVGALGRGIGDLMSQALGPLRVRLVEARHDATAPMEVHSAGVEVRKGDAFPPTGDSHLRSLAETTPHAVPGTQAPADAAPESKALQAVRVQPEREALQVPAGIQSPDPTAAAEPEPSRQSSPPIADMGSGGDGSSRAVPAGSSALSGSLEETPVALVQLLHVEIDRNKRYPALARRQRREGISTVAFSLRPDGNVAALALARSSGFRALDRAALSAVKGVEPFQPALTYLTEPRDFRIDVVFRLY